MDELKAAIKEVEDCKASLRVCPPKAAFRGAFPVQVERLLEAERRVELLRKGLYHE